MENFTNSHFSNIDELNVDEKFRLGKRLLDTLLHMQTRPHFSAW